jgi:hypothetical protein
MQFNPLPMSLDPLSTVYCPLSSVLCPLSAHFTSARNWQNAGSVFEYAGTDSLGSLESRCFLTRLLITFAQWNVVSREGNLDDRRTTANPCPENL